MWLTPVQVEAALYAARDVVARRRLAGRPVPSEVMNLLSHLLASADGTENHTRAEESEIDNLVDTRAAAEILGCSTRWVRHIRDDLDGRKVSGTWVFRRDVVVDYAERKAAG